MGFLSDLLSGLPVNTVLRERLALLENELKNCAEEKFELEKELAEALAELAKTKRQLHAEREAAAQEMTEEMGALFKRRPGGGYFDVVFCPRCRLSIAPAGFFEEFLCGCTWKASFSQKDLPVILARLNG